jgi:hypothetical protein
MGLKRPHSGRLRPINRLRGVNTLAATAFAVGGSLFAIGAVLAQADIGGPRLAATVYLVGGVFFSTGGYASVLLATNAPHRRSGGGFAPRERWRWWPRDPTALDFSSAVVLFVGTLVFAINLVDSMLGALTPTQLDRLVWSPDIIGCALFLISGHLAMVEIAGSWWRLRGEGLGWWLVVANQIGSILFMAAAVASFVRADGDMIAVGIANWGTCAGALCFALAGVAQEFEPPPG